MTSDRHQIWHTDREYDFMRNSNFSIGVLHNKRQTLTYFLWRHFSARSSFYCFITSPPEGVARYCFHPVCLSVSVCVCLANILVFYFSEILIWNLYRILIGLYSIHWKKILNIFYGSVFVIWLPSKSYVPSLWPWPLTYEGHYFLVNLLWPYKCPVWISDRYNC